MSLLNQFPRTFPESSSEKIPKNRKKIKNNFQKKRKKFVCQKINRGAKVRNKKIISNIFEKFSNNFRKFFAELKKFFFYLPREKFGEREKRKKKLPACGGADAVATRRPVPSPPLSVRHSGPREPCQCGRNLRTGHSVIGFRPPFCGSEIKKI